MGFNSGFKGLIRILYPITLTTVFPSPLLYPCHSAYSTPHNYYIPVTLSPVPYTPLLYPVHPTQNYYTLRQSTSSPSSHHYCIPVTLPTVHPHTIRNPRCIPVFHHTNIRAVTVHTILPKRYRIPVSLPPLRHIGITPRSLNLQYSPTPLLYPVTLPAVLLCTITLLPSLYLQYFSAPLRYPRHSTSTILPRHSYFARYSTKNCFYQAVSTPSIWVLRQSLICHKNFAS